MSRLMKKQDAYGQAVFNYYHGLGGSEIVERDDGYFDISGGPPSYFEEYKDWPAHQKKALRLVRGRVLDIGCGAGRVALHLQDKGHDVMALDISPLMIEVCKDRGIKNAKVLPITQIKPVLGLFDTIVMYGNNFGLFGSFKRARWLLKRFAKITTPGGRIIAESNDPYGTSLKEHMDYQKYNRSRGRMSGQLRIRIRYKKQVTPFFDYLLVSKDEMKEIVAGTGWRIAKYVDSDRSLYMVVLEKE
ncbi:MAG TPA: class I SAM-dependent methyltransferase [Phycisphaerae bacterium]|nr:class I SAM-dependent methyltransferase [Phycisphaerae bacterium]